MMQFPKPGKRKKGTKVKSLLQRRIDKPNSAYWKKKADAMWGKLAHHLYRACIVDNDDCKGPLNAHHLVSRSNVMLRHRIENCTMLCSLHHNFSITCSPHAGPIGFFRFLENQFPHKLQWVYEHQYNTGKQDYRESYLLLNNIYTESGGL
jgi:hypothetical protein